MHVSHCHAVVVEHGDIRARLEESRQRALPGAMRAREDPARAVDDNGSRMHDRTVAVSEQRGEEQHLPRIRDRKRTGDAGPQARRKKHGAGAPLPVDGDGVIGATRPEADERPAVGGLHDAPAQTGIEGDGPVSGDAAIKRGDGEIEGRIATDVQELPVEATDDPVAGSLGVRDGDRRSADGEAGSRDQVFERFLQLLGQTKLPIVFFVLIVLVVLFLHVWSATSLSTMSTRSTVGGV